MKKAVPGIVAPFCIVFLFASCSVQEWPDTFVTNRTARPVVFSFYHTGTFGLPPGGSESFETAAHQNIEMFGYVPAGGAARRYVRGSMQAGANPEVIFVYTGDHNGRPAGEFRYLCRCSPRVNNRPPFPAYPAPGPYYPPNPDPRCLPCSTHRNPIGGEPPHRTLQWQIVVCHCAWRGCGGGIRWP